MTKRAMRRQGSNQEQTRRAKRSEVAALLRALAERVEQGEATADLGIVFEPPGEVWMVSAAIPTAR